MCTTIVAGVDAPPVFELTKHVLNPVTLAVERPIVRDRDFAIDLGRAPERGVGAVDKSPAYARLLAVAPAGG